jgi:hypothetical protein
MRKDPEERSSHLLCGGRLTLLHSSSACKMKVSYTKVPGLWLPGSPIYRLGLTSKYFCTVTCATALYVLYILRLPYAYMALSIKFYLYANKYVA